MQIVSEEGPVNGENEIPTEVEIESPGPEADADQSYREKLEQVLKSIEQLESDPSEAVFGSVKETIQEMLDRETGRDSIEPNVAEDGNGSVVETQSEPDPEDLTKQVNKLSDQYLRALAEVENVRKIAERERLSAIKFGATGLARDLLPVHDNLKRALASVDDLQKEHSKALIDGVELTLRELLKAFGRHGISPVFPQRGDAFDPNMHQAMFEVPMEGTEAGKIIEVISEGFTIHERLLRAAHVGVSSYQPESDEAAG